jgi:hypothetical protein
MGFRIKYNDGFNYRSIRPALKENGLASLLGFVPCINYRAEKAD